MTQDQIEARTEAVRQAIDQYWAINFRAPTLREIMTLANLSSTSSAAAYIDRLREEGYLLGDLQDYTARAAVPEWVVDAITAHAPKED